MHNVSVDDGSIQAFKCLLKLTATSRKKKGTLSQVLLSVKVSVFIVVIYIIFILDNLNLLERYST